jgi:diguanylate cyclase (GGDEF)-like protein/PAS domain S-box-containing protein
LSAPDYPANEAERLLALYNAVLLDTLPEERFDRITRLAAHVFGVQTCLVSLIDSDRLWFKSRVGLDEEQMARDISFCGHAILEQGIFTVPDATQDPRFSDNPLVTSAPHIRFYAGAPVRDRSGQPIGTLCLIDPAPHVFTDDQKRVLRDLADMVEHEVAQINQAEVQRQFTANMIRTSSLLGTIPDMVFVIDRQLCFLVCNEHPDLLLPRLKVLGRTIEEVLPGELGMQLTANVKKAFSSAEVIQHHYTLSDKKTFEARCRKIDQNEVLVIIRNTTEQTLISAEVERLSEVARQTNNGVIITDENGLVVWTNDAFIDITGYSLDDIVGTRPGDLLQGEGTDPAAVKIMNTALRNRESFNVDVLNYTKQHIPYWVRISCNPMWGDNGELKGYIAIETDVTKEKRDSDLIRSSENLIKSVIEANNIGTWRLNMKTGELIINDMWAALLGYRLDELMPTDRNTWESLTHPEDLIYCVAELSKETAGLNPSYEANIRMKHKSGEWVWINTRGRVVSRAEDGRAEWLLGTHFDINARMIAESTLQEQSKQMRAIVENMLDGVITIDAKGIVCTFNRAAEQIFGYTSDEMIGRNVSMLVSAADCEHHDTYLSNYLGAGLGGVSGSNHELEGLHKNGRAFPIDLGLAEVQQLGEVNFIGIVRDITQRKKDEDEITRLAFYDPLTLMPNRRLLLDRLQRVIANCARVKNYAALLFLDLDNFKNLNDSGGHIKGDILLCQVAERLIKSVRQGDTVARLGGDEFVVVLEGLSTNRHEAANQAEAIAEIISAQLNHWFDLDGLVYNGSASIGVTMFAESHSTSKDLLKQADMAMYKAKAAGRNSVHFFDPQMQVAVSLRATMEQDLYDAIRNEQFQLYYQKQVDQFGTLIGVEVLLRWIHPIKGVISPAQFIPLAEETGLILPIGEWVLHEACKTLALWASDPIKSALTISVNISVVQFSKKDIVNTVLSALKVTGARPQQLKLEITESLLANDVEDVKSKMLKLQRCGVTFSIDDFGTGYSSLLYLKQLPISQLKIDQSFVMDIINSPNDQAIAQAVITLAYAMKLDAIAEGVETEAQRALLQDMGCGLYQGYLFGKPCALEDLVI